MARDAVDLGKGTVSAEEFCFYYLTRKRWDKFWGAGSKAPELKPGEYWIIGGPETEQGCDGYETDVEKGKGWVVLGKGEKDGGERDKDEPLLLKFGGERDERRVCVEGYSEKWSKNDGGNDSYLWVGGRWHGQTGKKCGKALVTKREKDKTEYRKCEKIEESELERGGDEGNEVDYWCYSGFGESGEKNGKITKWYAKWQ